MKKNIGKAGIMFAIIMVCMQNNGMGAASPGLASIAAAFPNVSYTIISMVTTLPTIAGAISLFAYPWLAKTIKKRSILYILTALYFIGSIGPAFLYQSIWVILFFRIVIGFACIGFQLYTMDLIVDFFDGSTKDRLAGVQGAMTGISGILFQTLGGYLSGIKWNYSFLATLVSVIFIILAIILLPEPDRQAKLELEKEFLKEEADTKAKLPAGVFVTAFLAFAYWCIFFIVLTNAPIILTSEGLAGDAQIGLIFSGMTVTQVIAGFLMGFVIKKIKTNIIPLGFAIGAAGMFILHGANNIGLFTVGTCIVGFASGFVTPGVYAKVTDLVPYSIGSKAVTAVTLILNLGGFFSPFIFGNLGLDGRGQLFVGGFCMIAMLILSIIVNILVKPKRDYNLEHAMKEKAAADGTAA